MPRRGSLLAHQLFLAPVAPPPGAFGRTGSQCFVSLGSVQRCCLVVAGSPGWQAVEVPRRSSRGRRKVIEDQLESVVQKSAWEQNIQNFALPTSFIPWSVEEGCGR